MPTYDIFIVDRKHKKTKLSSKDFLVRDRIHGIVAHSKKHARELFAEARKKPGSRLKHFRIHEIRRYGD